MNRLLITGSRHATFKQHGAGISICLEMAWGHLGVDTVLVHGAAKGVDTIAADIWQGWGLPVEPHPANWGLYGKRAGTARNMQMVNLGADLCLAFPLEDVANIGTTHCYNAARKAGILTHLITLEAPELTEEE